MNDLLDPSIEVLLRPANLRRLAGDEAFRRGGACIREHPVRWYAAPSSHKATALLGTEEREASLWVEDKELRHRCSCPDGARGAFCEHCAAIGLSWGSMLQVSQPWLLEFGQSLSCKESMDQVRRWATYWQEISQAATEFLAKCPELLNHVRDLEQLAENPPKGIVMTLILWAKRDSALTLEFRGIAQKFRKLIGWNRHPEIIAFRGYASTIIDRMWQLQLVAHYPSTGTRVREQDYISLGKRLPRVSVIQEPEPASEPRLKLQGQLRRVVEDMSLTSAHMQREVQAVKENCAEQIGALNLVVVAPGEAQSVRPSESGGSHDPCAHEDAAGLSQADSGGTNP
ncbi:MAG TPA: hypothetical protein PK280_16195 [Planctomycetota bacterium]|nr:hypothetical protein [Planctomycetota bacterium]